MDDDMPEARPTPKPGQPPPLTEAELSRIAREAVHQPADARLDKQLVRMGVMDAPEPPVPQTADATSRPAAIDPELVRVREELRRTRVLLGLLVGVIVVLAIVVVTLVLR